MAERRLGLPAAEREACARAAVQRLFGLPAVRAAHARAAAAGARACLSGYVAMRGELDPATALELARTAGFDVALPRIDTARPPRLRFHLAAGPDELCEGPHGLTQPLASCPEVAVDGIDVMLVPGLAFDAEGRRLGQGGGYYDDAGRRLRESKASGVMVGLAYDFQVVDVCPADERDVPVDFIVTDQRVLSARASS
jgi:5-formyltetrahydrofolate cyclo-ligase